MLKIENLTLARRGPHASPAAALSGVSLEIEPGRFFALLGPSGCGKTTLLRSIAGLETPQRGRVIIGGRCVFDADGGVDMEPGRRRVAMVFQNFAIWPHLSVYENVAFPLEVSDERLPEAGMRARVHEMLELVGLAAMRARSAAKLSGGEQQRLALARALAAHPQLVLLDEPLASLDQSLRVQLRGELKRLQAQTGATFLHVTHDQTEALALADDLAVMEAGRLVQTGSPRDLYERPCNRFVAGFIGSAAFVDATVVRHEHDGGLVELAGPLGPMRGYSATLRAPGESVVVSIRPEALGVAQTGEDTDPTHGGPGTDATVSASTYQGEGLELALDVGGVKVLARASGVSRLSPGDRCRVRVTGHVAVVQ